ncbi:hypothetical protein [Pedobacter sp. JCM 36344]|uniref:hypothetical protein n=1 Tax=Pedobacter sp. JCM 36344 TaxID=3374280 RepID=UPI00397BE819
MEERYEDTTDKNQQPEPVLLTVTEDIRSFIYESSKWTKFLSIVGFVFTGLMIVLSLSVGAIMSSMNNMVGAQNNPYAALGSGFLTVLLLISAAIYFYPSFILFKFSTAAKQAVLYGDQESLSIAMGKMKSFFKFWGILLIVLLGFYALAILSAIVAGVGAASMA